MMSRLPNRSISRFSSSQWGTPPGDEARMQAGFGMGLSWRKLCRQVQTAREAPEEKPQKTMFSALYSLSIKR